MLPQKPFYLIRHGESEANAAHIAAGGGIDSKLTDAGKSQPQELAPYLTQLEIKPTVIHHSTMIRAADTARFLNAELKLEMNPHFDLREHELGDWEGVSWDIVLPQIFDKVPLPNGENYNEFDGRIQSVFTDILNGCDDNDLPMIVCHGGVFHALGSLYEYGLTPIQNCHLHLFEPEGEWDDFPWRVTTFDVKGEKLIQSTAEFCLSRALEKIGA